MKKVLGWIGLVVVVGIAGFLLIQLIPYGHTHTNPPVVKEPNWDSAQTRDLAKRACFDCHSNETIWPWYSNVAPISWLVVHDTEEGRSKLNFSNWGTGRNQRDMVESVQRGKMPDPKYLITHPEAKLTPEEKQQLIAGLQAIAR